mmetsp:Transcript_34543/g.101520  ORF Transcript_34543/g.101520 Transcript_34543/m.101520 type:complete len:251 (-) Transcript_34543:144-896(-)
MRLETINIQGGKHLIGVQTDECRTGDVSTKKNKMAELLGAHPRCKGNGIIRNTDGTANGRILGIHEAIPARGRHGLAGIVQGRRLSERDDVRIQVGHSHGGQGRHGPTLAVPREDHAFVRVVTFLGTIVQRFFDLFIIRRHVGIIKALAGVATDRRVQRSADWFAAWVEVLVPIHERHGSAPEHPEAVPVLLGDQRLVGLVDEVRQRRAARAVRLRIVHLGRQLGGRLGQLHDLLAQHHLGICCGRRAEE